MSETVLTAEQQAVVDADLTGPRLVDAGAGTGKTFTLVARAQALIRSGKLRADELLVLTFTKAAATEIADRLEAQFDPADQARPTCGTFHAVAADVLREFSYESGLSPDVRVIDDGRARGIFSRAFEDLVGGRLGVDLSAFPLLDRPQALERSLATMILALKGHGADVPAALQRARAAAGELETLPFGSVAVLTLKGRPKSGWPRPDPERTREERRVEAARERTNVDVVAALFARFEQLLADDHLLTFGDILTRATRMLRERPAIARVLGGRWKHAIVDEFQDSNAMQLAFLEAIFGPDLVPLLAVGDVRQAIYEFNGAEPQGIVDFRARARERLPLTVNRRSLQPILDVAHGSLASLATMDAALNAPLAAQRGDADPRCVRVQLLAGDDALEHEAALVADTLRALVDRGVAPRDCAVLMRTRMRAGVFAQAIRERGLAVQLYGGVGFFDAPEIRDVVAWLRLAEDPCDPFSVTAALQSAAIGVSDGGVALLAAGNDLARAALVEAIPAELAAAECERIERFRRIAGVVCSLIDAPLVEGVRAVIEASGAEIARAGDERALEQVRANLEKLVRFAADFSADRPTAHIPDLVAELREREELELDLPIAEVEGDRIAMLTIHGAKGLEWKHVFLVDVAASFPLHNNGQLDKVAQLDPVSGALALKHAVDGRITLRWFLVENPHDSSGIVSKSGERRADAEEHRLLYVALTRAKDAVYVTGRRWRPNTVSQCFRAVAQWATTVSGDAEHHAFDPIAPQRGLPLLVHEDDLERKLAARGARAEATAATLLERRGMLSYTAMALADQCPRRARYHYVYGLPDLRNSPVSIDSEEESDAAERAARDPVRFGRVVHRVLERYAQLRVAAGTFSLDDALHDAFAGEDWPEPLAPWMQARAALESAIASLQDVEPIDAERRFELTIAGVSLGGAIDLIARDASGVPLVIDYKTGRSPAQAYALQFGLYRRALRADYPDARAIVLRISEQRAFFESVVPASDAELERAVANATLMQSDEARPGRQCDYCPYAHDPCTAAAPQTRAPAEAS